MQVICPLQSFSPCLHDIMTPCLPELHSILTSHTVIRHVNAVCFQRMPSGQTAKLMACALFAGVSDAVQKIWYGDGPPADHVSSCRLWHASSYPQFRQHISRLCVGMTAVERKSHSLVTDPSSVAVCLTEARSVSWNCKQN